MGDRRSKSKLLSDGYLGWQKGWCYGKRRDLLRDAEVPPSLSPGTCHGVLRLRGAGLSTGKAGNSNARKRCVAGTGDSMWCFPPLGAQSFMYCKMCCVTGDDVLAGACTQERC